MYSFLFLYVMLAVLTNTPSAFFVLVYTALFSEAVNKTILGDSAVTLSSLYPKSKSS